VQCPLNHHAAGDHPPSGHTPGSASPDHTPNDPGTVVGGCRAAVLVSPTGGRARGLAFTRYYEGKGYDKCVELVAFGNVAISLNDYEVRLYDNGRAEASSRDRLSGVLKPGMVFVVCNGRATGVVPDYVSSSMNFNGNDQIQIILVDGDIPDDVLGLNGDKPTVGNTRDALTNYCIVRKNYTSACADASTWCPTLWRVEHAADIKRKCDFAKKPCVGECHVQADGKNSCEAHEETGDARDLPKTPTSGGFTADGAGYSLFGGTALAALFLAAIAGWFRFGKRREAREAREAHDAGFSTLSEEMTSVNGKPLLDRV